MSLIVDIEKKLGSFTLRSRFETAGGTMALLGASGCGKSVTLKCIAGIMTPDRGRIVLDGETLFDSEKRVDLTPQQRRVGYLFQQYALFPNMSVMQNIQCGIRTGSRAEKQRQAAEQLRRFHLEGLERKYPAQLSGGQQQRAALARILCSKPRVILLDEPFSALDSFLKWNLELELKDLLADFGGPILWVSHDLGECRRNCQTVCVMENGVSAAVTDMETLLRRPASLGAARLTGCRNFLPAPPLRGRDAARRLGAHAAAAGGGRARHRRRAGRRDHADGGRAPRADPPCHPRSERDGRVAVSGRRYGRAAAARRPAGRHGGLRGADDRLFAAGGKVHVLCLNRTTRVPDRGHALFCRVEPSPEKGSA